MTFQVVGTAQDVSTSIDGSATPTPFNVTVETNSNVTAFMWAQWANGGTGDGTLNASSTLNGVTADYTDQIGEGAGDETATGVFLWYDIAAGSRSLDVNWDNAASEGPVGTICCIEDADTSSGPTDSDHDQDTGTASVTITTAVDDIVLKFMQDNISSPTATGGWTTEASGSNNNEEFRLMSDTATGTSTVCTSGGSFYSSVIAFAISEQSAAGVTAEPGTGSISFTGLAPTPAVTDNKESSPGTGAISFTGLAPTATATAAHTVEPGVGAIAFLGYAPTSTATAAHTVEPGVGSVAFSWLRAYSLFQ